MLQNFRVLSALCSLAAILILAGFFLTQLPLLIQIFLLIAGLIISCITMFGLLKFYLTQRKAE
jgi:hypothetical protein